MIGSTPTMRRLSPLTALLLVGTACGTVLDLSADDGPPAVIDAGNNGADGAGPSSEGGSPDARTGDAAVDASCGDTSSDPANCGACGRACNVSAACKSGACAGLVVFVTSATTTGAFNNGAGDKLCNDLAKAARLGGAFRAWMREPNKDRFSASVTRTPYYRTDGMMVAFQWPPGDDLMNPISLDEKRTEPFGALVWSDLGGDGVVAPVNNCQGWANPAFNQQGTFGTASATTALWTLSAASADVKACNDPQHLYCVEKP